MFLLFGFKIKKKVHGIVPYEECPHCSNKEYKLLAWRDWFHIFYIPITPIEKKRYYLQCTNCGQYYQIQEKEFNDLLKEIDE